MAKTCPKCGLRETRGTHKLCYECNPAPHGEARKYAAGCRCDLCRAAAREQERQRAAGYETSKSPHGSPQKYRNGCRCDLCTLASRMHRTLKPHGMDVLQREALMEIQNNQCPTCGIDAKDAPQTFHIDHSHNCQHAGRKISCSKCWRGLLCEPCNIHLERKIGHAYLREIERLPPTEEDVRVMEYIRNPPADKLREQMLQQSLFS